MSSQSDRKQQLQGQPAEQQQSEPAVALPEKLSDRSLTSVTPEEQPTCASLTSCFQEMLLLQVMGVFRDLEAPAAPTIS